MGGFDMNVYDQAHGLAKAIKECDEFKKYVEINEKVKADEHLNGMLDDFQKKQLELQKKQMMGDELSADDLKNAQELYDIINKDPVAKEYFDAEMRFNQMMGDVSKIIADAMDLGDK